MALNWVLIGDWIGTYWNWIVIPLGSLILIYILYKISKRFFGSHIIKEKPHKHEWKGIGAIVLHKKGKEYPRAVWACECGKAFHLPVKLIKETEV